ncbi:MAG: DPP IV N-terminal domain-containing protein, partial [Acidobacteriota bacterium]|nr:DPP IV N-terminal domain-containing protein [Acidobacteriota bacterium]
MKKLTWLFTALFVFSALAEAQEKMLSIDDIYDPARRVVFSGKPVQIRGWTRDGKAYKQFSGGRMVGFNALNGELTELYDTKKFVSVLTQTDGFSLDEANRIGQLPFPQFNGTETAILINHNNDVWIYDIGGGTVKRLTNNKDEELEADFSPDGKMVSFVRGMNLFVVEIAGGKEKQLTRDGGEKILNGYLDWVYEEELYGRGNKRGYFWSPDSRFITFLRTDENPVPKFVLPDDTVNDQRIENTDYPQAGDKNPLVTLGIADVNNGKVIFTDLSKYKPEDFLISRVAWSPDSKTVVFQAQDREQTFIDLNAANTTDGKFTTLFTERTPAWVEAIDNPVYLKDGSFIWQSEKDGFRHLYLIAKDGKMIRQITKGRFEIGEFYGVDEKNGFVYFSARGEKDWIGSYIYRIKLDGSGLKRLTETAGSHRADFNPTFTHFVDSWSDINTPTQTRLYAADGTLVKVLDENKVDVLKEYKLGKPEFLKVKTRDGFEMEAMMIKPPNFDSSKKYPVFAYNYSGPHAPSVRNGWGGTQLIWHQMLAQKGYIIWICDNRTASGKGVESTWAGYLKFGQTEVQDLDDGFSYLKSLPYVDGERLGMGGWSYGGYMTSYFMTHTKTLKAGIAGGLVGDWALYDSIYTERYMKTPQNNPDGYAKGSVIAAAKDLNGRLLIIHGVM